jgi:dTDP-4-dehydrorhamnose 3,5-epimerase
MKIISTKIPDVKILVPKRYKDKRGFFYESYNYKYFQKILGEKIEFVQDNHSKSKRGVIRGLHYQKAPYEQGKLIRVVSGEIFDVAVDLRKKSPTYGKWVGVKLSSKNMKQLWIPKGFAHGFQVISKEAEVLYKTTNYYAPKLQFTIRWDNEFLKIKWDKNLDKILSSKDLNSSKFIF